MQFGYLTSNAKKEFIIFEITLKMCCCFLHSRKHLLENKLFIENSFVYLQNRYEITNQINFYSVKITYYVVGKY